jgi:hypothetical protein
MSKMQGCVVQLTSWGRNRCAEPKSYNGLATKELDSFAREKRRKVRALSFWHGVSPCSGHNARANKLLSSESNVSSFAPTKRLLGNDGDTHADLIRTSCGLPWKGMTWIFFSFLRASAMS